MKKSWQLKQKAPEEFRSKFSSFSPLLVQLMFGLGLVEKEDIENFLHPRYEQLHSPMLFKDMKKAVDRIWQAVSSGERIAVYSDYDADGITAGAVLMQTFRYLGVGARAYVPDRFTEGYGLHLDAFEKLKQEDIAVVISVDCGTNSIEVAEFCRENNIDLIITDHHEITGNKPNAYALINPKNPDDTYPETQITGVGVAYKLAVALLSEVSKVQARFSVPVSGLASKAGISVAVDESISAVDGQRQYVEHWDKWLLDLVAIGTIADCHSLRGENRILVTYGLKVLAKTRWVGLRMLLDVVYKGKDIRYDAYTVSFLVAPRINAAGRLEHASTALDLLLSERKEEAQRLSTVLDQINTRRQELTARIVSEAREQALLQTGRKVLLVSHPEWHKGVVGLVAGRLASEYKIPTVVLERGIEESTGSARSSGAFDIMAAIKSARQYLVKFGGHTQAAGLTVKTDQIDNFYRALLEYAEQATPSDAAETGLVLDAELLPEDLTLDTFDVLAELEPFGIGNEKPKFLLRAAVIQSQRTVGNGEKHLQMVLQVNGTIIESIAFNMAFLCDTIKPGDTVDVACELIADSWNGLRKLKLRIIDCVLHNEESNR